MSHSGSIVSLTFLLLFGCNSATACQIDFFVKEIAENKLYLELINNGSSDYQMPYDRLPWVGGVGSMKVDVYVNKKLANPALPMGENSKMISIKGNSKMSYVYDLDGYRIFYKNVNRNFVKLYWKYKLPGPSSCKDWSGEIFNFK